MPAATSSERYGFDLGLQLPCSLARCPRNSNARGCRAVRELLSAPRPVPLRPSGAGSRGWRQAIESGVLCARKKRWERRCWGRCGLAALSAFFVQHRGVRRQAAPSDPRLSKQRSSRLAAIVVGNGAARRILAFPGTCGRSRSLATGAGLLEHPAFSQGQRRGANVLRARRPAHETAPPSPAPSLWPESSDPRRRWIA